ncbi:Tyrosine kinase domain protein [Ceratobasidium sp. AG-Ba]|nr:Tyrosine kinase domain protein [Ceratobasidium sp. AG-Ba]
MYQYPVVLNEQEVADIFGFHAEQAGLEVQRELDFTPDRSRGYALSLYRTAILSHTSFPSVMGDHLNRPLDNNTCPPGFSDLFRTWSDLIPSIQQLHPQERNNLRRAICGQPCYSPPFFPPLPHASLSKISNLAGILTRMGEEMNNRRNGLRYRQPQPSFTAPSSGPTFPTPSVFQPADRRQTLMPSYPPTEIREPSPRPYVDIRYPYPHSASPPSILSESPSTEAFTPIVDGLPEPHGANVSMPSPAGIGLAQRPLEFPFPQPAAMTGTAHARHQYQPPGDYAYPPRYDAPEPHIPGGTGLERTLSYSSHESNNESGRSQENAEGDFQSDEADRITNAIADVIGSNSSVTDIIAHLSHHGCQDLTHELDLQRCSPVVNKRGGYSDIYLGQLHDGRSVAIKAIFSCGTKNDEEVEHLKRAARELYTWSKCKHPRIAPLLGLATYRGQIAMISPWMEYGDVRSYVNKYPEVDRLSLCIDVAAALRHLHRNHVVHGDLKGPNILVSDEGHAMLIDFGSATLGGDTTFLFTTRATSSSMDLRWTAPEIFAEGITTTKSDVYSLGMTILEIFSGELPHAGKRQVAIIHSVMANRNPERPDRIPAGERWGDELWELLRECWNGASAERPTASQAHLKLKGIREGLRESHLGKITSAMSISDVIERLTQHGCTNLSLDLDYKSCSQLPMSRGGSSDVYSGRLRNGTPVAIKTILRTTANEAERKHLKECFGSRELYIWSKCAHPYVMCPLGLAEFRGQIAMVSRWTENGDLRSYILNHPSVDRMNLVHGDVKGPNVLISEEGNVGLTDFGNAIIGDATLLFTDTSNTSHSLRWTAPELLGGGNHSMEADVYALGMEAFTGKAPYSEKKVEGAIVLAVVQGQTPKRPLGHMPHDNGSMNDGLWSLLQKCWDTKPSMRPTATEVYDELRRLHELKARNV